MAGKQAGWERYAAPTAFLAVATIAILLVASALHTGGTREETQPPTRTTRSAPAARTTTAKTETAPDGRRFYRVVAGDTFGAIAAKTGTSVAEIERLNPGVSSTSLHIGQRLRVT